MVALLLLALVTPDFHELHWRGIGPMRGGRTKSATGVPGQRGVFYIGVCNGGVWKTLDYGRTWTPMFDDQPTGSVGAVAVAPSNPNIVYVGSGEGLQRPDLSVGDGIYKSTDAGHTWTHLGLRDGQQIPQIIVDPKDPNRLFVAVLGHPYGPNAERGIYRSTDGAKTFQKVLGNDADTGGIDVAFDPQNAQIVYAALWESRNGPWENSYFEGPNSGLYKSTDGGTNWRKIGKGLPAENLGRIGLGIAPSLPKRIFAVVEAKPAGGLYRSDDAGETFVKITNDARPSERASDMAEVKVHPKNPDIVFTASVVTWKSTDGGKTWSAFRGAPGGDDYQRIWIDPNEPDTMIIASDQGAIVTVDAGRSWSSWYNQSTAQMYHVTADNAFPYRLCGGQQESGSACVASRGIDGAITFREWHPVGLEEYGYAAPDPLDPDLVYGGKLTRYDRRTGQTQDILPRPLKGEGYRMLRTQPVLFSPLDPHTLYFASNTMWKTTNGGKSWAEISPDLTRKSWDIPKSIAKYRNDKEAQPKQRGVIYTIAPSFVDKNTIWAGTDDGLIHVTHDGGKKWTDVTPKELVPWAKVSLMDAGHFDARTAYAAINTLRLDDLHPYIYRTHDGGKSWQRITSGIPDGTIVNVVREDPKKKGLLFAGTEQQVFVSFDDGDHWQSLRNNMPASSIRDLIVKDDDLAVATHGRGFWILDDITPLRQTVTGDVQLLTPAAAWRVRWNTNPDTPLPPDEPMLPNPPDGAILHYFLREPAAEVVIEIVDEQGRVARRYSSRDAGEPIKDEGNIPRWWIRPSAIPAASAGLHRLVWDLHYAPPAVLETQYPIAAVPGNTPKEPRGPWAPPGRYTVRLTAASKISQQPLTVRMDPRVRTPAAALAQQFELSMKLAAALQKNAAELKNAAPERKKALEKQNARLASIYQILQDADAPPTTQAVQAVDAVLKEVVK